MSGKTKFFKTAVTCILVCCLGFSGCEAGTPDQAGQPLSTPSSLPSPSPTPSSVEEYLRAPMPGQIIPEGREIVSLGTFGNVDATSPMYKAVSAFNQAQEKYFVKIEIYSSYDRFLIDIARKQGTDLYNLYQGVSAQLLARKGILEDLTPYFENSNAISRDDIVDAVWRAGSVDDRLYFLIPGFTCQGILVEKGYTRDGAWSGKDYINLGKKYPDSMLNNTIRNPSSQILSELPEYMTAFIDWEDKTCRFDSDEFIALLEDLKALSDYNYEAVDQNAPLAELIHGKVYLSKLVSLRMNPGMSDYRDIMEAFGDDYEIAGYPTADGSLRYAMDFYDQIYGMNAGAENKEGAWAFFEYLVSEEYQQPSPPNDMSGYDSLLGVRFPARKDALEQGLQANVNYVADPNDRVIYHTNQYTKERASEEYTGFTEEDKQKILHIIDNSFRKTFDKDYTLLNILFEESDPFFQGDKSAKDVAKIIQSKVSLYLAE